MENVVRVKREIFTDNSTSGTLYDAWGNMICYTLEPSCNPPAGRPVAMPEGTYELVMQWSTKFKRDTPHYVSRDANDNIVDIAGGHSYVEIHPGNFEGSKNANGIVQYDSADCLLVGLSRDTDYVGQSRDAFNLHVMPVLDGLFKLGRVYIEISKA